MEKMRKTVFLPKDIVNKIDKYQEKNYLGSFTEAVLRLLIKGLQKEGVE